LDQHLIGAHGGSLCHALKVFATLDMKPAVPASAPKMPIDSANLRRALGTFLTGVTVVSCVDDLGQPRGFTANSFTSVSLDPPLVLVCIAKSAQSIDAFVGARGFGISILAEHQKPVSQLFASKSPKKFKSVRWLPGSTGAPRLAEGIAWFDCHTRQRVDAGDHVLLIGEVVQFSADGGLPLGYCQGNYVSFGLVREAVDQERGQTIFGCIVNQGDRVLLCRRAGNSSWTLPTTSLVEEGSSSHQVLRSMLDGMKVCAELSFLFSVYDVPERGETHIFYRGSLTAAPAHGQKGALEARLFDFAQIPWSDFPLSQTRSMLRRYLHEQAADSFGIYMDGFGHRRIAALNGLPQDWRADHESTD
jgi:flavin reductase (DIM6/NTAB) family NADH-FMN oxidoreductase RutF